MSWKASDHDETAVSSWNRCLSVSVGEVLLGIRLYLLVSRNPVEKFGAVARVFGVSRLIRLESFIMMLFLFKCSFVTPDKRPREIIASFTLKSYHTREMPKMADKEIRTWGTSAFFMLIYYR